MARPLVSVVIPTYNRSALLGQTLRQLERQRIGVGGFEVVVSDDGSSDETPAVVESFADRLRVKYHFQEDLGFRAGAARNAGARLASAPLLVFLDTGQMAGPDFLWHHLAAHADGGRRAVIGYSHGYNPEHPMAGIGEALARMTPEEVMAHFQDHPQFVDIRHDEFAKSEFDLSRKLIPWILFWTLNCSVRAADFWAVGGFDERFQGWGVEDFELGYRLYLDGVSLHVSREAWVVDAPHSRNIAADDEALKANATRLLTKYPGPVMEIGWAIVADFDFLPWEDDCRQLRTWSRKVAEVDVREEVAEVLRRVPAGDRIALLGVGGSTPESLPPSVVMDFDKELLGRALGSGRHVGHHAVGLRTPLADRSVDTVIITSRLAGLWDRWHKMLLAEAHRIGRTVHTFDRAQR